MELGLIGFGRMAANMPERLRRGGYRVVGVDPQVTLEAPAGGPARGSMKLRQRRFLQGKERP